MYLDKQDEPPI